MIALIQNPALVKQLNGEQEAKLIAMRLGPPPAGYGQWSLRLLADQLVALEIVGTISHKTVRKALKNGMTTRKIQYWVIPPKSDSEFVASMKMILDTYAQPYNSRCPVICMDGQPVQFQAEVRVPIPATVQHPKRVDYEYERRGTASIFMFTEPLTGWRQATARSQRTKSDWAQEVKWLLTHEYAGAERVILVCDNLNTHTLGAFFETFPPEVARELRGRLEIRYTPKHGSWLNIAENELSALTRQCMGVRRIDSLEVLCQEIERWASHRNAKQKGVDWQFKIDHARVNLKSLYPKYLA